MTKTILIATAAGLGLVVEDKDTKEILLEKVASHYSETGEDEKLKEFLDENGFALDEDGKVVKRTARRSLGENPNTKAFHTIAVLQDESLAHLTYPELRAYLKETTGTETTANSIAWYANWLKGKGKPCVARQKKKKEAPVEEAPVEEAPVEEVPVEEAPEEV